MCIIRYTYLFFICVVTSQDFSSLIDTESLSELPLESLLNVKRNILEFEYNDTFSEKSDSSNDDKLPEALPLLGKISKSGGYYVQYGDEHSKKYDKKKISTIFQLSVTTLAFLAFGGYLLYLVIAAIKGKQYNYMYDPNATQIMSAMINAQLNRRRRKRKKRPIRVGGHIGAGFGYGKDHRQKIYRSKRELPRIKINPESLYLSLINLCEGYSKFNEADSIEYESCYDDSTCREKYYI